MQLTRKQYDLIAIDLFDWDKALHINDVEEQVALFSYTLMNIMQNFVSNETIKYDDRDPSRMNKEKPILQTIHSKY